MLFNSRKGVSLPLETVVLLILAAVVLGALLAFFLGVFTPVKGETDLIKQQFTACQEISNKDSLCKAQNVQDIVQQKLIGAGVCKSDRPSCSPLGTKSEVENCIASCCKVFCPTA